MARKSAPGTLIHCDACGEDYSATYKRCPFCGEKPGPATGPIPPVENSEDDYVFEGQELFRRRGGRAPRPLQGGQASGPGGRPRPHQLAPAHHLYLLTGHHRRGAGHRVRRDSTPRSTAPAMPTPARLYPRPRPCPPPPTPVRMSAATRRRQTPRPPTPPGRTPSLPSLTRPPASPAASPA